MSASASVSPAVRVALVAAAILAAPVAGEPCSICRCGDATFNALGRDGFAAQGLRLAFDSERFDKDEGDPAEESESQVENRYTLFASYGFGDRFTLSARLPWSVRRVEESAPGEETKEVRTSGFSDPEVYGLVRLWASALGTGVGRRSSLSLVGGVKTPWGENDVHQDGERVDEHAQPGTGSTDVFGSLAFLYLFDRESALFASAGYRRTGTNDFGYRYGSYVLANVSYEHRIGSRMDGVVEANFRHAEQDVVDANGTRDPDTGGALLYLTPRLLFDVGHGLVLRAAVQIPVVKDLNGFQKERAVVNLGITYAIGTR